MNFLDALDSWIEISIQIDLDQDRSNTHSTLVIVKTGMSEVTERQRHHHRQDDLPEQLVAGSKMPAVDRSCVQFLLWLRELATPTATSPATSTARRKKGGVQVLVPLKNN